MMSGPEIRLLSVAGARRAVDETFQALSVRAAQAAVEGVDRPIVGVIAATFSNPQRFPSLAVRVAAELRLPKDTIAFDVQMACSAYPYALYLAQKIASDAEGAVLVVDGDVQTPLVDPTDHATGEIFSDAMTATVVETSVEGTSSFAFLSQADEALTCASAGPIKMDGFKVFSFVATDVAAFLRPLVEKEPFDVFVPHQANPYMIRQLAKALDVSDRLLTLDPSIRNPGSCSIPLALATATQPLAGKRLLVTGFGAGYSAAAGFVRCSNDFKNRGIT